MNYYNSIDAFMRNGGLFDPEGSPLRSCSA
jgi:hypothetical protein